MSCTALTTKEAGSRPPILPPVVTTFDGAPGDDDWLSFLRDDVRLACRHADAAEPDRMEVALERLAARERIIASEIWAHQATEGESMSLPPLIGLSLDYLVESPTREQRALQRLLDQLYECRARCERRLARHRLEMRLSEDLGTSNP